MRDHGPNDPLRDVRVAVLAGKFANALDLLTSVPAPARVSPDGLLFQAMAEWRLGDHRMSADHAYEALRGFERSGDTDGIMRSANVAAAGAFALGDLAGAHDGFQRAFRLADTLGDDLMVARCANNLGNVAYYRAELEAALSHYRLAAAGFGRAHWRSGLAECSLNQSIVLREAGALTMSLEMGDLALEHAEAMGERRSQGQALATRAETRAHLGDVHAAEVEARHAFRIAASEMNPLDEADALRILCVIDLERDRLEAACEHGERAKEIAQSLDHLWTFGEVVRDLATCYARRGAVSAARANLELARDAFERMGATVRATAMADRLAELAEA